MIRIISIRLAFTYNLNHSISPFRFRSLYKWIMTLFITNRRLFHMPRIYMRLFR